MGKPNKIQNKGQVKNEVISKKKKNKIKITKKLNI